MVHTSRFVNISLEVQYTKLQQNLVLHVPTPPKGNRQSYELLKCTFLWKYTCEADVKVLEHLCDSSEG
jgi:hypothetical protein